MQSHRLRLKFPSGLTTYTDSNANTWTPDGDGEITLPADADPSGFFKDGFTEAPGRPIVLQAPDGMAPIFMDVDGEEFRLDAAGQITLESRRHQLHSFLSAGFRVVPTN